MKKQLFRRKNFFLIMKIGFLHMMVTVLLMGMVKAESASGQELLNQRISMTVIQKEVRAVLKQIEKQTRAKFVYSPQVIPANHKVSLRVNNQHLSEVLEQLLSPIGVTYNVSGGHIVLDKSVGGAEQPETMEAVPPVKEIRGKVTDDKGEGLPGVSVLVKGTQQGTVTDQNGNFQTQVTDEDAVLVFSFVGFISQEVPVGNRTAITISLAVDQKALEEVVVVGYGVQKKTSVTAAVSTMKGEEIASMPLTNLSNGLGGRLSGVIVKQGSGEPGRDGSNLFIRGISSTGTNQPLLIVDNIPRSFQHLDPNTIESFTVLKDAAAVAPYGVAGANGVILVTTKRGKLGTPTLSYNAYVGFQNPTTLPDYVNGYEFARMKNDAARNAGLPLPYSDYALQKFKDGTDNDAYPNNDVRGDLIRSNSPITMHNIELNGGAERIKYYASVGYQHQGGMWHSTNNNRFNLTLNLDAQVTNTTTLSFNLNGRHQRASYPSINTPRLFELLHYAANHSIGPLYFSNGMYGSYVTGSILNSGYQKTNTTHLMSQLSLEQELPFIKGLKLKGTIAYDPTVNLNKTWSTPVQMASIDTTQKPYRITNGIFGMTNPTLDQNISSSYQLTYQAGVNYSNTFGKSSLSALALFEAKANDQMSLAAFRRNYSLTIDEINMGSSSSADMTTNGTSSQARQVGLVYRVAYEYSKKYLVEVSGRYDGSYYFAPENRYGFFPAYSVGWRISEEPFIKDNLRWVENLKLRASYGEVGALAGSPFQYLSTYNVSGPAYSIGGNAVQAVSERSEPNPEITWERAKKSDIGLEATLWNGLLGFEIDYFHEKRSNMLVNPDVVMSMEYGIGLSQVNAGIMANRGVDFSVGSVYRVSGDLQVSLNGNFTFAKNKLIQVFETPTTYNNPNRRQTGRPLGTQFGFLSEGFFQQADFDDAGNLLPHIATQPWGALEPGDIRYADLNGDGRINDDDLTVIGDPVVSPRIVYGIAPSIKYKGFTLDLLFQGAAKTNFYYEMDAGWAFFNGMGAFKDHLDYWTPENTNARNPRITSAPTTNNTQRSSFWMGDAKYLRLKNASLAYSLPADFTEKIKLQHVRVYLSSQNLLTWTSLRNFDPEVSHNRGWNYPQQKVTTIGLNVTF